MRIPFLPVDKVYIFSDSILVATRAVHGSNTLGMYLATGVAIGAMLLLTLKGWRRITVLIALPIILNGVIFAGSRGPLLGLLAGGVVVFFLCPPQRKGLFWSFAVLGVVWR